MGRRFFLIAVVFLFFAVVGKCEAAQVGILSADTMKIALRAGTPEEQQYIDDVVTLVNENVLPVETVQSTFLWAKKKSRYKFQYFKYGLQTRAKELGFLL